MSVITYNSVTLPYATTTSFRQEAVYDDLSHTDQIATRFIINVQCVVNADYLSVMAQDLMIGGQPSTRNPASIMNVIRSRLMTPRKKLSVTFGGVDLIPQAQLDSSGAKLAGTVDAMNGPQPQFCNLFDLTNSTYLMVWQVVANYWENNSTPDGYGLVKNQQGANVLYNRWTETVSIDETMMSTKTREGVYKIRSDNAGGLIADDLRSAMAVVSVPAGFLRASSEYTVSPDGLAIHYRVIDKEYFKPPPAPAFTATGEFVLTGTQMAAQRYGECRVRLKGAKTTSQADLLAAAITIVSRKCEIETKGTILMNVAFMSSLYDNEVECRARVFFPPSIYRFADVASFANYITKTPLSDPTDATGPPTYMDRGTANLLVQAAAYYDPSLLKDNQLGIAPFSEANVTTTGSQNNNTGVGIKVNMPGKQPGQAGANP